MSAPLITAAAATQMFADDGYVRDVVTWRGITIEVRYDADYLSDTSNTDLSLAHLEIESVVPERAPLPVTETGYRSSFLEVGHVEEFGGPSAYVRDWLDLESKNPVWIERQEKSRQLSLF